MRRDLNLYLWDMIRSGEDIQHFLQGVSFANYEENRMIRAAVERCFEIIGEAMTQARELYPELREQIGEHREIVAFRNRIIHGYFALDDGIVFSTARNFLPGFLTQLRGILGTIPE